jgi:Protein of unknown function (DUF1488)
MSAVTEPRSARKPRWDGSSILFEMDIEGSLVSCAISRGALQEVSGCHYIANGDLLRRFAAGRDQIEKIASGIFAVRPVSVTGTLHIWSDDVSDPPSAPAVACVGTEAQA